MMNISSIFLLLQFILFIISIINVEAQNFSDSTEGIPAQDSISNFQPSLAVVIGMLSIMFSLTFILLLYAKFCHRTSSSSVRNTNHHHIRDGLVRSSSAASGVDKTVVESLPFFRFSSLKGSREGLECSVCLSKFEDVEILRLLPKCKHAFHIHCIDQWLEKHSTCPLCRQKVSEDDLSQLPYSDSLRFLWNQSHDQSMMRQESNLELYVQREENLSSSSNNNNNNGSSRFSIIGSSFRKTKEEGLPTQEEEDRQSILLGCFSEDDDETDLHRFNHRINCVVSNHHHHHHDRTVLKSRWSNVSSSDLMFLNSEMINDASSARFSSIIDDQKDDGKKILMMNNIKQEMERKRAFESKLKGIIIKKKDDDEDHINYPSVSTFPTTSDSGFGSKIGNSINEKRSMSEIIVHPRFTTELRNEKRDSVNYVKEERMRRLWLPIARKTVQWFANRETYKTSST